MKQEIVTNQSIVSPTTADALIKDGYTVRVEKSTDRIYRDEEFARVGAEIVPTGSWVKAPTKDIILGLKEIDADGGTSQLFRSARRCIISC